MTPALRLPDTSPDLAKMPVHVLRTVALTPDAWYCQRSADAAVSFFRFLRHHKGEFAGREFELAPWQEFEIVRPLFGWKRPDGTRLFRRAALWVPRKNGKTQLAAAIGLMMLCGDGEPGAEVYSLATTEDQARIVFDAARAMVAQSPELAAGLESFKKKIEWPAMGAFWKPLSAKPTGKHGLNCSAKIGDELHEWADGDLNDFVRQSMATRRQPLEFDTSTAGLSLGFGRQVYLADKARLDGAVDDPQTLVVIYEASIEDDWQDPAVWAKANPNLGVSVKRSFLEAECRKVAQSPVEENRFKNYHLNIWTSQAVTWLQMHRWAACATTDWRTMFERMAGRPCYVGLDLSARLDVTAVAYVFPPAGDDVHTRIACRFYVPEDSIDIRARRDRVPYDRWVREGALIPTPGNTVDQERIFADLIDDCARFQVLRVGLDKWNTGWLGPKLVDHFGLGAPDRDGKQKARVVEVHQGYATMSPGAKELERLVVAGLLDHGDQPVLKWMAGNVTVRVGVQGDILPIKDKSADKIDGIVVAIIALTLAQAEALPQGPSVYAERGFIII